MEVVEERCGIWLGGHHQGGWLFVSNSPRGLVTSTPLMAPTTPDLSAKYTVLQLSVISSSSISNRTTSLITHIKSTPADSKPAVVALHAKAPVVNKLISIVEIAKRDLKADNQRIYQYNALGSELVQSTPVTKDGTDQDAMSDDEPAFEKTEQRTTVRNVPTMTTYLSLASVKELKQAYGYSFLCPPHILHDLLTHCSVANRLLNVVKMVLCLLMARYKYCCRKRRNNATLKIALLESYGVKSFACSILLNSFRLCWNSLAQS
jgi:hypothetical protein